VKHTIEQNARKMFDYFLKGERPAYVSRVAALDSCTLMHLRVLYSRA
jgi:hypothetical protein